MILKQAVKKTTKIFDRLELTGPFAEIQTEGVNYKQLTKFLCTFTIDSFGFYSEKYLPKMHLPLTPPMSQTAFGLLPHHTAQAKSSEIFI